MCYGYLIQSLDCHFGQTMTSTNEDGRLGIEFRDDEFIIIRKCNLYVENDKRANTVLWCPKLARFSFLRNGPCGSHGGAKPTLAEWHAHKKEAAKKGQLKELKALMVKREGDDGEEIKRVNKFEPMEGTDDESIERDFGLDPW